MAVKNLDKEYELQQKWDKVESAWKILKKAVVEYRKLEDNEDRDDAWYFGYILGSVKWTSSSENLKEVVGLGIDTGIQVKNMRAILLAREEKKDGNK